MNDLQSHFWRHKAKGGCYRVGRMLIGSGELHGEKLVVYTEQPHDPEGPMYARKLSEWHDKMEPIK